MTRPNSPTGSLDSDHVDRQERPVWLHWGLIVGGLYLLILIVLTYPVAILAFPTEARSAWRVYEEPMYWALIGILLLSSLIFLVVPVRITKQRPVSRASISLPIFAASFWMACLVLGACASIVELFKVRSDLAWVIVAMTVVAWIIWGVCFARISRTATPTELVQQQSRWMLRGSILELLIAVPSHIIVRGRGECCAGFFTFFGITMGLSVMLLSFGPAVCFLYYARWKRLHPKG